ncbi:hypothetical protein [Streptomyces phytophilus]|uniref:hypothetical protein n=1 Tax=Streptomyces phytophilus TaxID=722715 RepID=UPI002867E565|nr:hypothetical protein [Streptomyces phytophilus]
MPPHAAEPTGPPTISTDHRHRALLRHLNAYLRDSQKILADWDVYSDEHTDLGGWAHDEHAYGIRAGLRDADTAAAFEPLHAGASHLLATAETQLARLPADTVQSRWRWQIDVLRSALDQLDEQHEQWLQTRDGLPANASPGNAVYDDALAEYHAEAWSHLDTWATHGDALREINTAFRRAPAPRSVPPTTAPVRGARNPARK